MKKYSLEKVLFIAALISYLPAWYYTRSILLGSGESAYLVFACIYLLLNELLARSFQRTGSRESGLLASLYLIQSAALAVYGYHPEMMGGLQAACWHLTAVYYILARTGMLTEGQTGPLLGLDLLSGLFILPWSGFLLRLKSLLAGLKGLRMSSRHTLGVLAAAAGALLLVLFAWGQLAEADSGFQMLGSGILQRISDFLSSWQLQPDVLLSLPVGMWLFGLSVSALKRSNPVFSANVCTGWMRRRALPAYAAILPLASLSLLYAVFFTASVSGFISTAASRQALRMAPSLAVDGFYQLCRVELLNVALLGFLQCFLPAEMLSQRRMRALEALFSCFSIGFAILAGAKLGLYASLYGYTPRRVLAFFLLLYLLAEIILLICRIFRVLPAVRISFYLALCGFSLAAMLNTEGFILQKNMSRYRAGSELDASVLAECRFDQSSHLQEYTDLLLQRQWFLGRSAEEIRSLYQTAIQVEEDGRTAEISAGSAGVLLKFTDGTCVQARAAD